MISYVHLIAAEGHTYYVRIEEVSQVDPFYRKEDIECTLEESLEEVVKGFINTVKNSV